MTDFFSSVTNPSLKSLKSQILCDRGLSRYPPIRIFLEFNQYISDIYRVWWKEVSRTRDPARGPPPIYISEVALIAVLDLWLSSFCYIVRIFEKNRFCRVGWFSQDSCSQPPNFFNSADADIKVLQHMWNSGMVYEHIGKLWHISRLSCFWFNLIRMQRDTLFYPLDTPSYKNCSTS